MNLSKEILAKLPILPDAGDIVKQLGFKLEDFDKPENKKYVSMALKRAEDSINGIQPKFSGKPELDLLIFALACMMVRATGIDILVKKFSLTEAMSIEKNLQRMLVNGL